MPEFKKPSVGGGFRQPRFPPSAQNLLLSEALASLPRSRDQFRVLAPGERHQIIQQLDLSRQRFERLGFSAKDCVQPLSAVAGPGFNPRLHGNPLFVFFAGRPVVELFDRPHLNDLGTLIWQFLYHSICNSLSEDPPFLTSDSDTSDFGRHLYSLVELLVPCRTLWVFETAYDQHARFALKYRVQFQGEEISVARSPSNHVRMIQASITSQRTPDMELASGNISVDLLKIGKIQEIAIDGKAIERELRSFAFPSQNGYFGISFRAADIETFILTDYEGQLHFRQMGMQLLARWMDAAVRPLFDRLELIRSFNQILSVARHELMQSADRIQDSAERLQNNWDILVKALPRPSQDEMLDTLAALRREADMHVARLASFGELPFDTWGMNRAVARASGSFSVCRGDPSDFRPLALRELVQGVTDRLGRKRRFVFSFHDLDPIVNTDAGALTACLSELLTNADKYSPDGRPIALEFRATNNGLSLGVLNEGDSLTSTEQRLVMLHGYRGIAAARSGQPGSGGGLSLVKDTLEDLGCRFEYAVRLPGARVRPQVGDDSDVGNLFRKGWAVHVATIAIPKRLVMDLGRGAA